MKLTINSLYKSYVLDPKEIIKVYDCKTDEVVYGPDRWEFFFNTLDSEYDEYYDREISYIGAGYEDTPYLEIFLSE